MDSLLIEAHRLRQVKKSLSKMAEGDLVQLHIDDAERFSDDHSDVVLAERFAAIYMEVSHIVSDNLADRTYLRFTTNEQCGVFMRVLGTYLDLRRFFGTIANFPLITRTISKNRHIEYRATLTDRRAGWQGRAANWVRNTLVKIIRKIDEHGSTPLDEIMIRQKGFLISTEDHPADVWDAIKSGKMRQEVEDILARATPELLALQWPGIFKQESENLADRPLDVWPNYMSRCMLRLTPAFSRLGNLPARSQKRSFTQSTCAPPAKRAASDEPGPSGHQENEEATDAQAKHKVIVKLIQDELKLVSKLATTVTECLEKTVTKLELKFDNMNAQFCELQIKVENETLRRTATRADQGEQIYKLESRIDRNQLELIETIKQMDKMKISPCSEQPAKVSPEPVQPAEVQPNTAAMGVSGDELPSALGLSDGFIDSMLNAP